MNPPTPAAVGSRQRRIGNSSDSVLVMPLPAIALARLIYYLPCAGGVEILMVARGARDQNQLF